MRLSRLFFIKFCSDNRGSVAIIFALSTVMILVAVGAGLDLARAYQTRQKLAEVAMLGCQYATRPTIIAPVAASNAGTVQTADYISTVSSFVNTSLSSQKLAYTQTNSAPFTYTAGGVAQVSLAATVPTVFLTIMNVNTIPLTVTAKCYSAPTQVTSNSSPYIVNEGFETPHSTGLWNAWLPTTQTWEPSTGGAIPKITSFNKANTYKGSGGQTWVVMGYCVEIDQTGQINSTSPQGSYTTELNCDNGSGTAGDSSISTEQYLNVGEYELRYFYRSRVLYPDYDPMYIAGSQISDVSWATDSNSSGGPTANAVKNNQIDVFLDADNNGSAPTHLINDGTMSLAGSNVIDSAVYAKNWIQRSVRIYVTTAGYYWLSFAADGTNNSYGGQLDQIQLCVATCPGSLQDNFPFTASQNLFEDTFESPTYSGSPTNTSGNMYNSDGTSGSSSGWPSAPASGWAAAPTNQLTYWRSGCSQGTQCLELGTSSSGNSLISRPFLLAPGYYQLSYDYVSEATFAALSSVYCGATPTTANISTLSAGSSAAKERVGGASDGTITKDTNTIGVFMAHAQMASTPNLSSTLGSTTSYTNPDGTTTTTPTVAPNGISLTSYNSSQVNPLLDICGYAATSQTRTAAFLVEKPAYYWLTFSALATSDTFHGQIDDVKITALGSPYMSSPPSSPVTIPVPSPQSSGTVSYSGFYIVANPLAPPAP